jgi:hypothetical protein
MFGKVCDFAVLEKARAAFVILFRFDGLAMERYTPQNGSLPHDAVPHAG